MSTMPGAVARAAATASSPDATSPTTCQPRNSDTTVRAASRNGGWSSTISTPTVSVGTAPLELVTLSTFHRLGTMDKGANHPF